MQSVNNLILNAGPLTLGEPIPVENIPEILQPFWCNVHELGIPTYTHRSDSKYCKVYEIVAGKEWRVKFEDMDEAAAKVPDWDYDEPTLHCILTNDQLLIILERYGGWGYSDIYYGDTMLWQEAGGFWGRHVGEQQVVGTGPGPPPNGGEEPTAISKYLPLMVGGAMCIGLVAVAAKKK